METVVKRKITKFKFLDKSVEINFVLERDDMPNNEVHSFTSADQPTLGLKDALHNLSRHVIDILELDKHAEIEVTGFSLKHAIDTDENPYLADCVLTAKYKLQESTGTVALNTPKRSESECEDGQKMAADMAMDLKALIVFVEKYLDGDRVGKQDDLFSEENSEE